MSHNRNQAHLAPGERSHSEKQNNEKALRKLSKKTNALLRILNGSVASVHPMDMASLSLQIEKMHCGACVRRVTQTLNALPSTHAEEVQIGSARVTSEAPLTTITEALAAAGFPAQLQQA